MKVNLTTASLIVASISVSAVHAQTITTGGTVNSADYSRSFAPGAIISIFGSKLSAGQLQATSLPLPTSLNGTSVKVVSTGELLPLFYVSQSQINAQLPYDVPFGTVQIAVTSAGVTSAPDTISIAAAAPKIFTLNVSGTGGAVATDTSYNVLTTAAPAKPAGTYVLWMNSLGATTGSPVAGQPAPGLAAGSQALSLLATPTVTVNGQTAVVLFAGLTPGLTGLYQINFQGPFVELTGPVSIAVTIGSATTQANVTIPYQELGFYFTILGGKSVAGQSLSAVAGSGSSLAYQQNDAITWGQTGFQAWTNQNGLGSGYAGVPGEAVTLYNGSSIVFDNNGIDTGTSGAFYNNTGGGADSAKPGLSDLYSMSNYFPLVFATNFQLSQSTTITKMEAYFDALGSVALPFDPANPFVKYRMNIFSNASGLPKQNATNPFVGDVFSSDTVAGTFTYVDSGARMTSSVATNVPKVIYRLTYTLASPITLPPGSYWFANDASIRATAAASSTANSITEREFTDYIARHQVDPKQYRFSFFGQEMFLTDSLSLPSAVRIRPNSPIEKH
jgi:uncharacterized protein (TIGR03437 family)